MTQNYESEFKKKIVRLHLEEGRALKSIQDEYGVSKASVSNWVKQFRNECQTNEKANEDYDYMKGHAHKVFPNLLNQDFVANGINQKWCTDFTYLFLTDGSKRYNCSVLDLYDRSIVASITDKNITSDLAIRTVKKALESQSFFNKNSLILHSDQGSQYTSKEFTEFCEAAGIMQSMSRAGCPYDNAPMERYYNTLKNEKINHHYYHTDEELNMAVEEFSYVWYNHVRPHSYNNYRTPHEARYGKRNFSLYV